VAIIKIIEIDICSDSHLVASKTKRKSKNYKYLYCDSTEK